MLARLIARMFAELRLTYPELFDGASARAAIEACCAEYSEQTPEVSR